MRYGMTPRLIWTTIAPDLKAELERRYGSETAEAVLAAAKPHYHRAVQTLEHPDQDRIYFWSLLRGALLAALYLGGDALPGDDRLSPAECSALLADAVRRNQTLRRLARGLRQDFTDAGSAHVQRGALMSQMRTSAYSWNYVYSPGPTLAEHKVTYRSCGIMRLYHELGIPELLPAACRFPDLWCELAGVELTRTMCLAQGDPCCDFGLRLLPDETAGESPATTPDPGSTPTDEATS